MLNIQGLSHAFGKAIIFDDFDFTWPSGKKTVGLLGANGSGKTTLFNILSGFIIPDKGYIYWQKKDISYLTPEARHKYGITRTFQIPSPFLSMTIKENTHLVAPQNVKGWDDYVLQKLGLYEKKDILSSRLNPQDQRILEIARSISTRPKLLLLDECMAGLRAEESEKILDALFDFQEELNFLTIVIEHNLSILNILCDHLVALSLGKIIYQADVETCLKRPLVQKHYFQGHLATEAV